MREHLLQELTRLRTKILLSESSPSWKLDAIHPNYHYSARNLLHYLAMRQYDLRTLQEKLALAGLSSLGRAESHVLANLDTVLKTLFELRRIDWDIPEQVDSSVGLAEGRDLLAEHTNLLLGPVPSPRTVRIMVTMSTEAATDYELVEELVASGMDCIRINCAHDDVGVWTRMIDNAKRAQQRTGRQWRILMDLAGPKLRTGPLESTPAIIKWHPKRNERGKVLRPARIWLTSKEEPAQPPEHADACLIFPSEWLNTLTPEATVRFFDARDLSRRLTIVESAGNNRWAECVQTTYVTDDTLFQNCDPTARRQSERSANLATTPTTVNPILLKPGDPLVITRELVPGKSARTADDGTILSPATIGITLPQIFADVRKGEPIWFDDGKIGGVIKTVEPDHMVVEIVQARPSGEKLSSDKGINLPESRLHLPALTGEDLVNLKFVAANADIVGYSFVQSESDLAQLQASLRELGREDLGIILKIETRRAFENLPELLLAAMRCPRVGVMIARGDLAVECGYERLAEVQEEILWISEAAHVPVIWATQVLEHLAKSGVPSRAEITDAAMGERAECVMLNKGPHIVEAVRVLDNVLRRMEAHQSKKSAKLRQLQLATRFRQTTPTIEKS
jgi:pyruvate kinase